MYGLRWADAAAVSMMRIVIRFVFSCIYCPVFGTPPRAPGLQMLLSQSGILGRHLKRLREDSSAEHFNRIIHKLLSMYEVPAEMRSALAEGYLMQGRAEEGRLQQADTTVRDWLEITGVEEFVGHAARASATYEEENNEYVKEMI